jgi:hypothetical protein
MAQSVAAFFARSPPIQNTLVGPEPAALANAASFAAVVAQIALIATARAVVEVKVIGNPPRAA